MTEAAKWMSRNGYYQGEILQYSGGNNTRLVSVAQILEEYANQSAIEDNGVCPICKKTPMILTCPTCTRELCSPPQKPIDL